MERQELEQARAAAPRFELIRPDHETFHMERRCWEHLDYICKHEQIDHSKFYTAAAKHFPHFEREEAVPALILTWLQSRALGWPVSIR